MLCFAANSLLCRAALGGERIDAISFTTIRLASGAVVLALLARGFVGAGSWLSGAALAGYAVLFSIAYVRIGAGVGALLLFGAVQSGLIGWGIWTGERPRPREWLGAAVAFLGLIALNLKGVGAPDVLGALWMIGAGLAWAVYTLRGRRSVRPLAENAGNFARALPVASLLLLLTGARGGGLFADSSGVALAVASGAVASGLGYAVWYAALRGLTATRAAVVQLSVVPLTALGAVVLLGEVLTPRLVVCGAVVLGGIALAVTGRALSFSRSGAGTRP